MEWIILVVLAVGAWFYFSSCCPNCKKAFCCDEIDSRELDRWKGTKKIKSHTKDRNGHIISSREEYVPCTYVKIETFYICENCGYEWSEITKKEK